MVVSNVTYGGLGNPLLPNARQEQRVTTRVHAPYGSLFRRKFLYLLFLFFCSFLLFILHNLVISSLILPFAYL